MAQTVKNLAAFQEAQEMWVWSLGQEDFLEKSMATHPSILACRIPWTEETGGLQSMGSHRLGHDWAANTFTFTLLNQFNSVAQSCPTLCDPMNCTTPGLPVHHQLPESTQTHVHGVGDAIQPSHPLLSPSPPAPNPSQHQGLFQWVNSSHEVTKVLEFQLQHQSFQWTPRTDLSFRMDLLDLLAVQGTLKSLLQHQSSKASIFQCSAFFTVRLSHPYMTTGKIIGLTRWT